LSSSTYSYGTVLTDLEADADAIGSSGLTAAQASSLTSLLQNVSAAYGTTSYVYSILDRLVTAGGAVGTTQAEFNTLLDQWFLGTDDPTPLSGAAMVSNAGSSLFPTDMATSYQYIDQGYDNGDCWLVATLIETAAVNPSELESTIWENANGTYGVRFCSSTGYVYLTVNADLMSNDEGAYSTDGTIWAGLLEKAFVEAQADGISFPMSDGTIFTSSYANDYDIVSNGGWDEMLKAITGRRTNYYQLSNETALAAGGSVYEKILTDTQNGIDVLFASYSDTSYGLVSDHMFAVLGIDQSTGDYIFYNPWGAAETSTPEFEVTPQELNALYQEGTGDEFLASDGTYYFTETTLCHLAGTLILTPAGERPIEDLRIGEEVVTRFGAVQRIKWIGEQHYDGRFIARNRGKIPVKIAAGAFGDNLPRRDLYLSPGHSVLLDDLLILAQDLVNGVTITQEWRLGPVSYYNIELAAHDCVLAEGVWSETYADGAGLRRHFHNAASYWALHQGGPAPAEPVLCAPRPGRGDSYSRVLARVTNAAEARITPGPTCGYVEQIGDEVTGWAFDPGNPSLPVRLHIYAGTDLIGLCFALEEREDVRDAGFGTGRSGFRYVLPAKTDPASIIVRRAATGAIVPPTATLAIWSRVA
jgi:hypothetical protein